MHYYKEETHEITPLTMAVLCERDEEGKIHSKVLEELRDYHVQKKPTKVVDYACKYFGSSLKGWKDRGVHKGVLHEDYIGYFYKMLTTVGESMPFKLYL